MIGTGWQDFRYGVRLLRLNLGFALVAILSLALGIGANTAIFQLMDEVRLRTLPVPRPQELAEIRVSTPEARTGLFNGAFGAMPNPLWEQVRDHQQGFLGICGGGECGSDDGFAGRVKGPPHQAATLSKIRRRNERG